MGDQLKIVKVKEMILNETIVTAIASVIVTLLGKEFWIFWKNRDTIKGQINLNKKIVKLEKKLIRSNTAVSMLLTYLESKYGDDDHDLIEKVRKYISDDKIETLTD